LDIKQEYTFVVLIEQLYSHRPFNERASKKMHISHTGKVFSSLNSLSRTPSQVEIRRGGKREKRERGILLSRHVIVKQIYDPSL